MSTLSTFSHIWRSFHIFLPAWPSVLSSSQAHKVPRLSSAAPKLIEELCIHIFFFLFFYMLSSHPTPWTPNMMLSNLKPLLSKVIYCMAAVYMQPCVSIYHIFVLVLRRSAQETVSLHASICLHLGGKRLPSLLRLQSEPFATVHHII